MLFNRKGKAKAKNTCKKCGTSKGPISKRGYCSKCVLEAMAANTKQLVEKKGPAFEKWAKGLAKYLKTKK